FKICYEGKSSFSEHLVSGLSDSIRGSCVSLRIVAFNETSTWTHRVKLESFIIVPEVDT
ncbi:hypothetical protein L9F63_002864, partial [Diploptera punctata]